MAGFGIKVKGVPKVQKALLAKSAAATNAMEAGLFVVANQIFNESQQLVPVDTGALRGSGSLTRKKSGLGSTMLISYGGSAASYALKVHEDVNAYHAPPTQAKYLEAPYMKVKSTLKARIEAAVKAAT